MFYAALQMSLITSNFMQILLVAKKPVSYV